MKNSKLLEKLGTRENTLTLRHILENSKADSGGDRDINFLKYLLDNKLLTMTETVLKRSLLDLREEYYLEKYKKASYESDRHFLCRTMIQEELEKIGIDTIDGMGIGNMDILRSNSSYDIVTADFEAIIDVGLTPARNYFRGLTDLKVKNYLIATYFDDYIDDIIFSVFTRTSDEDFLNAVKDYADGFKVYTPQPQEHFQEVQDTGNV